MMNQIKKQTVQIDEKEQEIQDVKMEIEKKEIDFEEFNKITDEKVWKEVRRALNKHDDITVKNGKLHCDMCVEG